MSTVASGLVLLAVLAVAGGLVLPAANARELNDTLDSLLRGNILLEK